MGEIIGFLLAVRKRSFWRTSPAGAHTVLIRVPEGMRKMGRMLWAATTAVREGQGGKDTV